MPTLIAADDGHSIGPISEAQLQFLVDQLVEESAADTHYYLTADTIDLLASKGADDALVTLLQQALGSEEGVDVRWVR
jgi:processive 1,2-diacylglycerol beta-glucosyltransferase